MSQNVAQQIASQFNVAVEYNPIGVHRYVVEGQGAADATAARRLARRIAAAREAEVAAGCPFAPGDRVETVGLDPEDSDSAHEVSK
jgi:hypothetical protein